MKAKTSDSDQNCFTFPSSYSLSLANTCTENFVPTGFGEARYNNDGLLLTTPVP